MTHPVLALVVVLLLAIGMTASAHAQAGETGGAGIGLKQAEDGRVIIDRVAPNGPADRAGIRAGDWLVGVNDEDVADLDGSQLVDAIRGPVGTKVVLIYVRGDNPPVQAVVTRASLGAQPANPQPPRDPAPDRPVPDRPAPGRPAPGANEPARPVAPARAAQGTMKFTRQVIKDPAAGDRDALYYLQPEGWQSQGQIVWMPTSSVLANLQLKLWDPAVGTTIEWLPTSHFSYTDQLPGLLQPGQNWMGAIVAAPVNDAAQFVEGFYAPRALPHLRGVRPTAREDFPKIAHQAIANDAGWTAQAVRLRYPFEREGKAWEEDVHLTLAYAPVNGGVATWNVQRAFTCRAPRGELDRNAGTLNAIVVNATPTPEWLATYSVVKQLFRQGLQQQMADTAALGRSIQQYNDHIRQLGQHIHDDRMKSWDRIAESQREYLGGVETYTDPYQQQGVYMPAGYKEYWVNQKGEVVMSEKTGYDPNAGDTNDWRKMERRDPMRQ